MVRPNKLVDQPEYGTNRPYVVDIIPFRPTVKLIKPEEIKTLYLKDRLSTAEIATRVGASKTFVISVLHKLGIRKRANSLPANASDNYRTQPAPYGYEIRSRQLQLSKKEQKICKLIVHLIRSGQNLTQVANDLSKRGIKTRMGKLHWHHYTVKSIYDRWKDRL